MMSFCSIRRFSKNISSITLLPSQIRIHIMYLLQIKISKFMKKLIKENTYLHLWVTNQNF